MIGGRFTSTGNAAGVPSGSRRNTASLNGASASLAKGFTLLARLFALFLLCASSAFAQTVQNPSFTQSAPIGSWNSGPIPGWKVSGTAGLLAIPSLLPSGVPVVAWSNGGTISQDLGPADATKTYTLTVSIVRRTDALASTYTISIGTCSEVGLMSAVPAGTSQTITLPCATPGELNISLACAGVQCDFGGVTLTSAPLVPPPPTQNANFSFSGQVLINGAPVQGTINVFQLQSVGSNQVAALTPDASGNISGAAALTTNYQDIVSLNVYNYDASGALINQGSIMPFPGAFLQQLHGVTGFVLMLNCAIPVDRNGNPVSAVPQCTSAPGTVQGTLQ